ncbi:DUF63 family protein [Natronomonas salsuginis]|uniref:DUF63 family protein n=1 Tax=Natronomonas salsuginis TaxID=2217661 RepID=A0A4U5JCL4_9EURY|nr:DUF63 family protein [Natronomonas salsuginis]
MKGIAFESARDPTQSQRFRPPGHPFETVVLPTGFALPALPYLAALVVGMAVALAAVKRRRPPVTAATVTALAPWMAGGGALYALYQAGVPPKSIAPLFGSPAVYVTTGVLAALVWAAVADRPADTWESTGAPFVLAGSGGLVLLAAVAIAATRPTPNAVGASPFVSVAILLVSIGVAAAVWTGVRRRYDVHATGTVGALAVFAHTLDGVSTAVGYDLLGFGEQTPLSRIIIEASAALPTAELIGAGWLFALVKMGLGALIVVLFEEYVRAEPAEGYLLLGLVTAVGLGPGAHNLLLFAIA